MRTIIVSVASAVLLSCYCLSQIPLKEAFPTDVTVRESYVSQSGSRIDLFGVCSIDPSEVKCWDANGQLNLSLAIQVTQKLTSNTSSQTSFAFGKKNRYFIFRMSCKAGYNDLAVNQISDRRIHNSFYFDSVLEQAPPGVTVRYDIHGRYFEPSEINTFVDLIEQTPLNETVTFSAKAGSKFKVLGQTYNIKEAVNTGNGEFLAWHIPFQTEGNHDGPAWDGSVEISDVKGNTIKFLDGNSKPITQKEWLKQRTEASLKNDSRNYPKQVNVSISSERMPDGSKMTLFFNVDPKYISSFTLRPAIKKTIRIEGIPLDPID